MDYKKVIIFFILLIFIPSVLSVGDTTHCVYGMYFLQNSNSEIAKMCRNYEDYFLFGCFEPDITVFDYFKEEGVRYKATHNWGFQQAIMERATDDALRCYSYGIGICHYGLDIVSHNYMVTEVIKKYSVPNAGSHVAIEAALEAQFIKNFPDEQKECLHMLDIGLKSSPKYDGRVIQITQEAVGVNSPINVQQQTEKLAGALGNLYSKAFIVKPNWERVSNLVGNLVAPENYYKYFSPNKYEIKNTMGYYKMEWLANNWASRNTGETPHGLDTLTKADKSLGFCLDMFCIFKIPDSQDNVFSIIGRVIIWIIFIIIIISLIYIVKQLI